MRKEALALSLLASLLFLAACDKLQNSLPAPHPSPSAQLPTPTLALVAAPSPLPSSTPVPSDTGWINLHPGFEQRVLNVTGASGEWLERITILRLDPARFRFDVAYRPGDPQSLVSWQEQTGALLVVNGAFFTETYHATGLIVANGQRHGVSYEDFGGMFAVTENGPTLRWLPQQPYDPDEPLLAALQAFPMLLTPGGNLGPSSDDGQRARRTVVARDVDGRILFLLAGRGNLTLMELSRMLQSSDLALDTALNLDGGASSGLYLSDPPLYIPPLSLLPSVIAVHAQDASQP